MDSVEQARQINPHLHGLSILRNRYALHGSIDHAYDAALRHAAGTQQSVFRYSSAECK